MKTHSTFERALFLNEDRYPSITQLRQFFNYSVDIICSINLERKFVHINNACMDTLGYSPEEMAGYPILDFVVEEDWEKTRAAGESILRGEDQINFENRYTRKDGGEVTLSWACRWDPRERLMFCIGRDVTEKKAKERLQGMYEQKVKAQNREMKEMLERITDGFFALDEEWRFIYGNSQVERVLDAKWEDFLTKNYWDCFPTMVGSVYYEQFHKAMEKKVPVHFSDYFPPFDKWFSVDAYPSETGLSVFFRDVTDKVKAEEERRIYKETLELQNKRLVDVLERMNQGFFSLDKQLRVTYWNQKSEEIIGLSKEETIGKEIIAFYNEEALAIYKPLYVKALERQQPIYSEHICPQNGRWTELTIYPSEEGFSVFFKDIDERKQIEQELQKLSLVAKETVNAVIMTGLDHRITWVNDGFTKMTGYTMDESVGKMPGELLYCDEADPETINYIRKETLSGKSFQVQVLNRTKNDGRIWWEVFHQPVHDQNGNVIQYFLLATDITERKHSEAELKKLSLIAEKTVNAVAICDSQRRVVWVNKANEALSGYTAEEVIGKFIGDVYDGPETDPEVIRYVQVCHQEQKPFHVEVLNYKKNRETYWAEVSSQPLFDERGNLQYYFSIATDITERKKLEKELEEQRKKMTSAVISAQEKERSQIGLELHDNVNQVLTSVKLYQDLILSGIGSKDELSAKSSQLLQESINEIRSLSKRLSAPTLGKMKLSDSVKELVNTVAATNRFKLTLDTEAIEELDVTEELHLALYRILQEHLTNILKYADACCVQVLFDLVDGCLILKITDDGKGFDMQQKRTGIGITNMTTRAESLNGYLILESAPGKGCELVSSFPLEW